MMEDFCKPLTIILAKSAFMESIQSMEEWFRFFYVLAYRSDCTAQKKDTEQIDYTIN